MKTLAILSQKGGTGKTTLTVHLAVAAERAGFPVACLDLDPQSSASAWADSRPHTDTLSVTSIQATRLTQARDLAAKSGAALTIIDSAPHSADAAIAAAEAADLILTPCRPGILDLRAIATTAKIIRLVGKPGFVVLNHAPPRAPRLIEDAIEAAKQHGMEVAPVVIHQRSAFAHSLVGGQVAQEYEPEGKASEEITALFKWVSSTIELC